MDAAMTTTVDCPVCEQAVTLTVELDPMPDESDVGALVYQLTPGNELIEHVRATHPAV